MKIHISVKRLLQYLLVGALLAGGTWVVKGPPGGRDDASRIVVSAAVVAHERARWLKQWGRAPTDQELRRSVDAYVRSEVLYREALARQMDRADPRVRLALIQKMDMLSAGRADAQELTPEDVAAFFALRSERYRIPAQLTLRQVLFKAPGDEGKAAAQKLLVAFSNEEPSEADIRAAGDPTLLENLHRDATEPDIAKQFGPAFATALRALPTGKWAGPVRSTYGFHVVKVETWEPARIPELEEVRARVENDLRYEAGKSAQEQGYLEIAGKYQVMISDSARALLEGSRP